jgi:alpha-glucosidase (family GH31 glycosyl hydrolase)
MKRYKEQKREELVKHGCVPFKTDASERVLGFS